MSNEARNVRWGILGTARIARKIAAAIAAVEGAELAAVASRDAGRAARWAVEHGAVRSYGSYAELLDDPDLDVIYVPLPPSLHAEWTIRAAERGRHVLCEKPLALSAAQAEEMLAACRERGVQLLDGVMWLHHPRAAEMRETIVGGTLGELRRVTSAFSIHWPDMPHDDLRMQRALGGGSLGDLGWYPVGATLWAFEDSPTRVFGTARRRGDVDVNFSGTLWFERERTASFDCGFDVSMRKWFEIAGTKGSLVCDDFTRPWNADRPRHWIHGDAGKVAEVVSSPRIQEQCLVETLTRIARTGEIDDRWPALSLAVQRVVDALDRSSRTERIVELAPL